MHGLLPAELRPEDGADLDVLLFAVMLDLERGLVDGGEAPPAGPRRRVGEDAVRVGLHDLRGVIVVGGLLVARLVVVLDLDVGVRDGLAFKEDLPLEGVAGVVAPRTGERNDLGLDAGRFVPALVIAEGGHDHLGVVDDELVLGGLPIGLGFDGELIDARTGDLVVEPPGLLAEELLFDELAEQVLLLAVDEDLHGGRLDHRHAVPLHRMGEGDVELEVGLGLVDDHGVVGDDHPEVGLGREGEAGEDAGG